GLTWTGSGNRPSGIKVTQGTARPANEGGYYMHFSSVSDYFKDYTYLLAEQGIYKVKGANNIDAYTKGLFRFGGAAYDYAAAGYGHYAPLMRSIRNGINSASNGAMDTLDNQFKTAGTVGTAPVSQKADKVISVLNALTAKKGTRIGSGQCYGLVAWHAMSIGGPGLGGGVTGLRGLIGAGAAASHIGEDYNWSQFGWKVVRPSQVNHLIPGSIANIRANAGGPVWTGGWGHTVVIKGLSGDTLTVLEQNYAGRQWVEERTYSASAYLRIIQTLCYPPEIVQGKRIDGTESSPAPSGTPGNNEPKTISETQQQEKTVGIPADLYREWKNEDGVVEFYIKNGSIYAPISKELYPSAFTGEEISDNWIRKNVEYETIDVEKMISYSLQDIRKNCYPSISYEVKGTDENLDMGDTVKIDDEEFPGGLVLSARVSEQHISFTNDVTNQTVFDNYKALKNKLSKDLINRYEELAEQAKPFELRPITDKGTTFKNSTGLSVLTAELWKSNKQYDATFQFRNFDTLLASGLTYTVDGSTVPIDKPFLVSIDAFIGNGLVATRQITFTNVMDGPKGDKGDKGALDETQVKEITDKIDTKSDQAMTQEQLNLLLETQNLMTAEMKSKATAEQVDALFASYNKYVSDESVNKANTEAALIANAERIEAFRKDFDDKMVQLDFVSNYMRVTDLGFEISANDGSSSLLIQKDRISMFSAGKEVMYISQGLIHIDNGVFTKTLQIGNFRESQLDGDSTTNVTIYVS
ncbi:CHAP domain-containing protein, partial [Turicibacter sanguinis]|nr:CHAP domain-containing protein [Turicibacter sanguinis]